MLISPLNDIDLETVKKLVLALTDVLSKNDKNMNKENLVSILSKCFDLNLSEKSPDNSATETDTDESPFTHVIKKRKKNRNKFKFVNPPTPGINRNHSVPRSKHN